MLKKILFTITIIFIFPILTYASTNTQARIGNNYYDNLSDAIFNASSTDVIKLLSNVILDESLSINKTVNINLNGNDISAPSSVFEIRGGSLTLTGKGTIRETSPNYGAIKLIGSSNLNDFEYSTVKVEKDVTLEGWSGIFITHDSSKSYGVNVYLKGKINAISDINGDSGVGIYVNGNIQDEKNSPEIKIYDNAEIYSNGTGLYIAGYTNLYIYDSYIEGNESGIGIKSGKLTIDGATIVCNGKDTTPTEGYNNGIKASGTTIQIESNIGYAGNIDINILDGTFTSHNSNVIYEYIGKGTTTQVKNINISGGTFNSKAKKNVFLVSNSFNDKHTSFISGGKFSSNPTTYLKSGYSANLEDTYYYVTKSTMKSVFFETETNKNNFTPIFIVILLIIILVMIYLNRNKLLKLIKKI